MEIFLIGLAIICIFIVITSLFTSLGENTEPTSITSPLDLRTPDFFTVIESKTNSSFKSASKIAILNNGDEFLPDFLNEIEKAKKSITITNYIWSDGEMSDKLFDVLIKKAGEGVKVLILLDGLGGNRAPNEKIDSLKKAGGKVEVFRPIALGKLSRAHRRTHIRAMVIDGTIGYTGGLAFDDQWLGNGIGEKNWRDMMFKVEGNMTESLQNIFSNLWSESSGEILAGSDFYPNISSSPLENMNSEKAGAKYVSMFHSPTPDMNRNLSNVLWLSIMGAKKHIFIITPYLLPDKNIEEALITKVREGVLIEIILPGTYHDAKHVQAASRSFYRNLLKAGIKIYEYQPGRLHTKMFTADGSWSLVGSANLDNRSNILNVENLLGIDDKEFAENLEKEFQKDKENSKEITKDSHKENWIGNTLGLFSRTFVKQY